MVEGKSFGPIASLQDIVQSCEVAALYADGPIKSTLNKAAAEIKRLRAALQIAHRALKLRGPGWPLDEVEAALREKGEAPNE